MSDSICPVCKKSTDDRHDHVIQLACSHAGAPLAFVINLQLYYDNALAAALQLSFARQELKEFFPGKEFEIQPFRLMVREGDGKYPILNASVASYVVFEK